MTHKYFMMQMMRDFTCNCTSYLCMLTFNNTPQGYARKRTLKPGGSSFCAEGVR
jgi:hypothetical protein